LATFSAFRAIYCPGGLGPKGQDNWLSAVFCG
jgi:hypothetical protein